MKKIVLIELGLCIILSICAQNSLQPAPQNVQIEDNIDSLSYNRNTVTMEAVIIPSKFIKKGRATPYAQTTIRIPATVSKEVVSTGGTTSTSVFDVVGIADNAFVNAKASAVEFASPSHITTIGNLAFSSMANMSGTLTLPASLDSLALSAIILPNITKIVFLGATPPRCALDKTSNTAYNPWTSSAGVTAANIEIAVPEGAKDAYKAAAGIGDYFTCLKNDTATELDEISTDESHAKKVVSNGRVVILRNGKVYSIIGVVE